MGEARRAPAEAGWPDRVDAFTARVRAEPRAERERETERQR